MKHILWICIALSAFGCNLKETDISPTSKTEEVLPEKDFPESWLGKYEGNLEIFNSLGKTMDVKMGLEIEETDSSDIFRFAIIYGKDKTQQVRDYRLITKDKEKGLYAIDEQNSIILDNYFLNRKLICRFGVMDNLLLSTYEKKGKNIEFEILMGKEAVVDTTGGKDSIPSVNNYSLNVRQIAVLKPVKK